MHMGPDSVDVALKPGCMGGWGVDLFSKKIFQKKISNFFFEKITKFEPSSQFVVSDL